MFTMEVQVGHSNHTVLLTLYDTAKQWYVSKFNLYPKCCEQESSQGVGVSPTEAGQHSMMDRQTDDGEVIPVGPPYADDMRRNPTAHVELANCTCQKQ